MWIRHWRAVVFFPPPFPAPRAPLHRLGRVVCPPPPNAQRPPPLPPLPPPPREKYREALGGDVHPGVQKMSVSPHRRRSQSTGAHMLRC